MWCFFFCWERQLASCETLARPAFGPDAAAAPMRRREEERHHRSRQNPYMLGQSGGSVARHDL